VSRITAKEIERNRDQPREVGKYISDSTGNGRVEKDNPTAEITSVLPHRMSSHSSDAAFRVAPGGAT
jgi:hypothetical protein